MPTCMWCLGSMMSHMRIEVDAPQSKSVGIVGRIHLLKEQVEPGCLADTDGT